MLYPHLLYFFAQMTFEDIKAIILSYKKVAGINVRISARLWGEAFAADSEQASFKGQIARWQDPKDKKVLMILWEGYSRNQAAPVDKMDVDEAGDSLSGSAHCGADAGQKVHTTDASCCHANDMSQLPSNARGAGIR